MKQKCLCLLLAIGMLGGCAKSVPPSDTQTEAIQPVSESSQQESAPPVNDYEDFPSEELTITADSPYFNTNAEFGIIGFQKYTSIEGPYFTDTPAEGNCYLVLFLSVKNLSTQKLYMSPDDVVADIDGTAIENTFLLNNPENYKTIFQTVYPSNNQVGFIVWEVPEDWQKLTLEFRQLQHLEHVHLNAILTPDDYLEAPYYNEYFYN